MLDIRLIQGLLIGICISLITATVITAVDVTRHKMPSGMGVASAAPAMQTPPADPSAQGAGGPAAAAPTGALASAPQGTWAVFVVDFAKVLASPTLRDKVVADWPSGLAPDSVTRITGFALPPKTGEAEGPPGAVAVATLKAGARPQVEQWLAGKGTALTVAGVKAYKVDFAPPAPAGAQGPGMATPPKGEPSLVALVDDTTALGADNETDLATLINAHKSGGGVGTALNQFLAQVSGATFYGAALLPPEMLKEMEGAAGKQAQSLQGLKGMALKANVDKVIDLQATLRYSSPQQAQQLVASAKTGIADMKKQAGANPQGAAMMQPLLALLDKIGMSTQNTDAKFAAKLSVEEIQQAGQMAMMMAMSAAMSAQGGGMMGPPPPSP